MERSPLSFFFLFSSTCLFSSYYLPFFFTWFIGRMKDTGMCVMNAHLHILCFVRECAHTATHKKHFPWIILIILSKNSYHMIDLHCSFGRSLSTFLSLFSFFCNSALLSFTIFSVPECQRLYVGIQSANNFQVINLCFIHSIWILCGNLQVRLLIRITSFYEECRNTWEILIFNLVLFSFLTLDFQCY